MSVLQEALTARLALLCEPHDQAVRLLNGFSEGLPGLVVEVYGRTLVILDHAAQGEHDQAVGEALEFYRARLPWLRTGLLKRRMAEGVESERLGRLVFGEDLDRKVREGGVWYALDLRLNQDTSFYIDTGGLRSWLRAHSAGLRVLNTFAYTGSLGAACRAGGAVQVLQTDLNRRFLNLARQTYALNGWAVERGDFLAEDFFRLTARLRRSRQTFDLVILDPPFFSEGGGGRVDLVGETDRLVNKVRPLVEDGGRLVAVNNALYLSGQDYLSALRRLCADGYLKIEEIIPVRQDAAGYIHAADLPADPAPFNHATKIVVLSAQRKLSNVPDLHL